ncbi:MAG: pyridoxal phosphate-dependent aminotransferase [Desulfacinum sp.]|nr:pyridoxal phosphate-dependent aminotransferase [Desulfacinum sp.]
MTIAHRMRSYMERASWIRKMFEEGARLKSLHGAENVFDFSLGNPNVPPPPSVKEKLQEIIQRPDGSIHSYMPNAGLPATRERLAEYLSREHGVPLTADHVVMTCGAAGALNIVLKALLDPGDEVVVPAPFFVEYGFYAENHGGELRTVPTQNDFTLDLDALEAAIGLKTKVVLINSPNNPTGQIYDAQSLKSLGEILRRKSRLAGRTIFLVSDEPYRKIVYTDQPVPSIFQAYENALVVTSFSKDLSLPGERIGYAALHPEARDGQAVMGAMVLANRILGFVNAPALMQWILPDLLDESVDMGIYRAKRDRLYGALKEAGYDLIEPPGAFYLFPRSPLTDDVAFVKLLQEENILAVPGSGFGGPGHFRLAYCVDDRTIEGALPGFARALEKARNG